METFDVSIIVVNFNTKKLLIDCLNALKQSDWKGFRPEFIVIDNGSTDGSVEEIKKLKLKNLKTIYNSTNVGFSAANNQGMRKAQGHYLLLLNSDTEVQPNSISTMIEFMESDPHVGAASAKLVLESGEMDPASHRGFPSPWAAFTYYVGLEKRLPKVSMFSEYHQSYKNVNTIHEVDCISGAFFLTKQEVVKEVGMLDEKFFMYGEDIDWCYRIKKAGWKIYFNSEVSVLHKKKQSGRASAQKEIRKQADKHFYDAMRLFYNKHYAHTYGWFTKTFVLFGIKLRSMV